MAQPGDVDRAARELADLFRAAQADIDAQLQAIADDPRTARRRARLRDLDRSITALTADLEADTRRWLESRFPGIYGLGAEDAAVQLGERFEWTQPHIAAMQALVGEMYGEVLAATRFVRQEAKRFLREQVRRQTGLSIVEGRTATQAGRVLASAAGEVVDLLGGNPGFLRYADGSYRRLADWADMAIRTTTARAYNAGTLNTFTQFGVGFVEVLDGSGCGWSSHEDPDRANGSIRSVEDAYRQPLAHPRCRRSFAARPDVRGATAASRATTIRSEASLADQAQAEVERAETFTRRRQARQARQRRERRRQARQA